MGIFFYFSFSFTERSGHAKVVIEDCIIIIMSAKSSSVVIYNLIGFFPTQALTDSDEPGMI